MTRRVLWALAVRRESYQRLFTMACSYRKSGRKVDSLPSPPLYSPWSLIGIVVAGPRLQRAGTSTTPRLRGPGRPSIHPRLQQRHAQIGDQARGGNLRGHVAVQLHARAFRNCLAADGQPFLEQPPVRFADFLVGSHEPVHGMSSGAERVDLDPRRGAFVGEHFHPRLPVPALRWWSIGPLKRQRQHPTGGRAQGGRPSEQPLKTGSHIGPCTDVANARRPYRFECRDPDVDGGATPVLGQGRTFYRSATACHRVRTAGALSCGGSGLRSVSAAGDALPPCAQVRFGSMGQRSAGYCAARSAISLLLAIGMNVR